MRCEAMQSPVVASRLTVRGASITACEALLRSLAVTPDVYRKFCLLLTEIAAMPPLLAAAVRLRVDQCYIGQGKQGSSPPRSDERERLKTSQIEVPLRVGGRVFIRARWNLLASMMR